LSWFLAFLGFAVLVILHELGHFAAAKAVGMRVEKFSLFFPPTILKRQVGETEYALGTIPMGGYVRITGMNPDEHLPDEVRDRAYHAQPVWKRIVVIAAGPLVNLVLALVLLFVFYSLIGQPTTTNKVETVQRGYPAFKQLEPGDRLISVDGRRGTPEKLSRQITGHRCRGEQTDGCRAATPVKLVVQRGDRRVPFELTPIQDAQAGYTRLGFTRVEGAGRNTLPVGKSADASVDTFWFFTRATLSLPARLFNAKQRKEISGVVGSYEVTRQTILTDLSRVVQILAIISLSLAIVNLFPFLPLDGGHIFWAIVEKIRRKPVPIAVMERAGVIGFMLVIGIFLLGLTNDIDRLSGEGFQVR